MSLNAPTGASTAPKLLSGNEQIPINTRLLIWYMLIRLICDLQRSGTALRGVRTSGGFCSLLSIAMAGITATNPAASGIVAAATDVVCTSQSQFCQHTTYKLPSSCSESTSADVPVNSSQKFIMLMVYKHILRIEVSNKYHICFLCFNCSLAFTTSTKLAQQQ